MAGGTVMTRWLSRGALEKEERSKRRIFYMPTSVLAEAGKSIGGFRKSTANCMKLSARHVSAVVHAN